MEDEAYKPQYGDLKVGDMEGSFFLIGIMNEFMNRFQTVGDSLFKEMSWKQCFALICMGLFEQPPTLKELSEVMGSSHQNVKQILLKLEREGYVEFVADASDRRKQRILATQKAEEFSEKYAHASDVFVKKLFQDIHEDDLKTTIYSIIHLDDQLKDLSEDIKKNGTERYL